MLKGFSPQKTISELDVHRWQSSDRNAAWGWNRSSSPWAVNYQCQDGAGHMDSHVSALSSRQSGEGVEEEWAHILTMTQNQPSVQVRVTSLRRSLTCEVTERWESKNIQLRLILWKLRRVPRSDLRANVNTVWRVVNPNIEATSTQNAAPFTEFISLQTSVLTHYWKHRLSSGCVAAESEEKLISPALLRWIYRCLNVERRCKMSRLGGNPCCFDGAADSDTKTWHEVFCWWWNMRLFLYALTPQNICFRLKG